MFLSCFLHLIRYASKTCCCYSLKKTSSLLLVLPIWSAGLISHNVHWTVIIFFFFFNFMRVFLSWLLSNLVKTYPYTYIHTYKHRHNINTIEFDTFRSTSSFNRSSIVVLLRSTSSLASFLGKLAHGWTEMRIQGPCKLSVRLFFAVIESLSNFPAGLCSSQNRTMTR